VSSPAPAQIVSLPFGPPLISSSPAPPKMTSLALLPTMTSFPGVPMIVTRLPWQVVGPL
jgi:hypothetical protein